MTATVTHAPVPAPQPAPSWLAALCRPLTPAELAEVDRAEAVILARRGLAVHEGAGCAAILAALPSGPSS